MHVTRIVTMILLLAVLTGPLTGAATQSDDAPIPNVPAGEIQVARIPFASRAELARLASRLDIWEVARAGDGNSADAGSLIAPLTRADADWLHAQGFTHTRHVLTAPDLTTIIGYPCYRTIDELYAQLAAWATAYPGLAHLRSVGASYEGRPLLTLRLTNETTGLDKPVFFLMANIHGRELITPEVAMQFIARLLAGYGRDPDVTWILDHQIVEVMVSANPDGHVKNEGQPWAYWRKNTNPTYGDCWEQQYGVDLNRNSSWRWGGPGASPYPCDLTYRGPAPASEPETQAVEAFLRSLFPDARPPDTTTPAPADKAGLFISLHSYSNLVLWPWGDTTTPAPNGPALARLGAKMASYNGYAPMQSNKLYPTSGATDDFAYGELGVAAYTFEIGSSADGFYPACTRYDALVDPNLEALFYGAKVTRAPYLLPGGPDALDLRTTAGLVGATPVVTVTARLDAGASGNRHIAAAEVYVAAPPWQDGAPHAASPVDGAFDSPREEIAAGLPAGSLSPGRHQVYVRGQNGDGAWGPVTAAFLHIARFAPDRVQGLADPGTTITYALALTNTTDLARTYTLTVTGAAWPTGLVPSHLSLSPGAAGPITVTVTVPSTLTTTRRDSAMLVALSAESPTLIAVAPVETSGVWSRLHLPLIMHRE